MTEQHNPPAAENTAQEIAEVIQEFEQYRERLVQETVSAAQKAKLPPKAAMTKIEPELAQIDASLAGLRDRLATMTATN
jgi:hypothetical protein